MLDKPLIYMLGKPDATGVIRAEPSHFSVTESLRFDFSGTGEHNYLWVRKSAANTEWVAGQLAKFAGVSRREVQYAGRKDRHAVTWQWFSVQLPGREVDWSGLVHDEFEILKSLRHTRKLRRNAVRSNQFVIKVTQFDGSSEALDARLERIKGKGFPNYFGPQRFGRDGENLTLGLALLLEEKSIRNRDRRSMALSAVRSALFNEYLSRRLEQQNWAKPLIGDALMLAGSDKWFSNLPVHRDIPKRVAGGDLYITGPLPGRNPPHTVSEFEQAFIAEHQTLVKALGGRGLASARRALSVRPEQVSHNFSEDGSLTLACTLPRGAFATSLLRELLVYRDDCLVPRDSTTIVR